MDEDDPRLLAENLIAKGKALNEVSRWTEAEAYFAQALKIAEDLNDPQAIGRGLVNIGEAERRAGRLRDALGHLQRALGLLQDAGDQIGQGAALNNLALVHQNQGQPQQALDYIAQSLNLRRIMRDRPGEARTLNSRGVVYIDNLDRPDLAVADYDEALEILRTENDPYALALVLTNKANALRYSHPAQGRSLLQEALRVRRAAGDLAGEARVLDHLGHFSWDAGDWNQALAYHSKAATIERSLNHPREEAAALSGMAATLIRSGRVHEALARYEEALRLYTKAGHHAKRAETLSDLAHAVWAAGRPVEANDYFEEAISAFEAIEATFLTDERRADFQAVMHWPYRGLAGLKLEEYARHPNHVYLLEEAFQVTERGRARAFLHTLGSVDIGAHQADSGLMAEAAALFTQSGQIMRRLRGSRETLTGVEVEGLEAQLRALEERYETVQRRLRQGRPRAATTAQRPLTTLASTQARLGVIGSTLLEYVIGRAQSWLMVITPTSFRVLPLPDETTLERQVKAVIAAVRQRHASLPPEAYELYQTLIGPALDVIATRDVVIAADGPLHYLPFELLPLTDDATPFPDGSTAPYLVRRYALTYTASAALLLRSVDRRADTDGPEFIGLAPVDFKNEWKARSLPSSEEEVVGIRDLYPAQAGIALLRQQATKEALRALMTSGCRYLHFATHGMAGDSSLLSSGIVLAPDSKTRDGYLSAAEVMALTLPCEMAVLSACDTGLGRLIRGEGLIGLTRAFMIAGAGAVLVSLWRVNDRATAELMKAFYMLLKEGVGKPEALRRAKLSIIEGAQKDRQPAGWSSPFFWAAFVLVQ